MTHDLKPTLAARVRSARKVRGITQAGLAEAVSRTVEAVSNIERGMSLPPIDLLQRIASVLDVPLGELIAPITGDGPISERATLNAEIRAATSVLPIEHLRVAARQIAALADLHRGRTE